MSEILRTKAAVGANLLALSALTGCGLFEEEIPKSNINAVDGYKIAVCDEGRTVFENHLDERSADMSTYVFIGRSMEYGVVSVIRDGEGVSVGVRVDEERPSSN